MTVRAAKQLFGLHSPDVWGVECKGAFDGRLSARISKTTICKINKFSDFRVTCICFGGVCLAGSTVPVTTSVRWGRVKNACWVELVY